MAEACRGSTLPSCAFEAIEGCESRVSRTDCGAACVFVEPEVSEPSARSSVGGSDEVRIAVDA